MLCAPDAGGKVLVHLKKVEDVGRTDWLSAGAHVV